jgi:hypothetical protein
MTERKILPFHCVRLLPIRVILLLEFVYLSPHITLSIIRTDFGYREIFTARCTIESLDLMPLSQYS